MRRALVFTVVAAAVLVGLALFARSDRSPDLGFDASVPDDLRALATETWQDFLAAHDAKTDCIAPATLHAVWNLDDRGEYQPSTATITVRVPGTAPNLQATMIHEFAHHVEFTCPDQGDLRPAFLVAQGFPPSVDWFGGDSWETTPSEQYAETTVEVVLGRRPHHGNIWVTEEAADIVRRWGAGT
jgi:hypothetical protein